MRKNAYLVVLELKFWNRPKLYALFGKTLYFIICLFIMEFPHELKELYPNQIIEVRGNADALTIILNSDVNIHQFKAELIKKFSGLE